MDEHVIDTEQGVKELAEARRLREGSDVTLLCYGAMVPLAEETASRAADEQVEVEVLDLRSLLPLDIASIVSSVEKTGRLVVVDPAHEVCSVASEISSIVAQEAFWSLQAPIIKVAAAQVNVPYSPALEPLVYPTPERVLEAVRETMS